MDPHPLSPGQRPPNFRDPRKHFLRGVQSKGQPMAATQATGTASNAQSSTSNMRDPGASVSDIDQFAPTLFEIIQTGKAFALVTALQMGEPFNLDAVDRVTGLRPLSMAVKRGNALMVMTLLGKYPDAIHRQDPYGNGSLHLVCRQQRTSLERDAILTTLLKCPLVDPNLKNAAQMTPLMITARWGWLGGALALYAHPKTELDITNDRGETAYQIAAVHGHYEIAKLISKRLDPRTLEILLDKLSKVTKDALDVATHRPAVVAGRQNTPTASTLTNEELKHAASLGVHIPLASLLSNPANINSHNTDGATVLATAAAMGYSRVIKTFLGYDAVNPNVADNVGVTPLMQALHRQHLPVVQALLADARTDAEVLSKNGRSATYFAWQKRFNPGLQALYSHRAKRKSALPAAMPRDFSGFDWSSGRGLDVVFEVSEKVPYVQIETIGFSSGVQVLLAECQGVRLAVKVAWCARATPIEPKMNEVALLRQLRHPHIVQVLGTYQHKKLHHRVEFGILLYPAADCDLHVYLSNLSSLNDPRTDADAEAKSVAMTQSDGMKKLRAFFACLCRTLQFLHAQRVRHKDIKPQNILVDGYNVYFADFGISKQFESSSNSETAGPTSKTPQYAAPELADDLPRSRPADIYALGCVFLEMMTVLCGRSLTELTGHIKYGHPDARYYRDQTRVDSWIYQLQTSLRTRSDMQIYHIYAIQALSTIKLMMHPDPKLRPLAETLYDTFDGLSDYKCPICHPAHMDKKLYAIREPQQ